MQAPSAVLEVTLGAFGLAESVATSAAIVRLLQTYAALFELQQDPPGEEAVVGETLVIRLPLGTLTARPAFAGALPADRDLGTPKILHRLWAASQGVQRARFSFRRTLVCATGSVPGRLLPIVRDQIELL